MEHHRVVHPLDPLLHKLAHFTTEADLSAKIHSLFGMLDIDDNGAIGTNSQKLYIENTSIYVYIRLYTSKYIYLRTRVRIFQNSFACSACLET